MHLSFEFPALDEKFCRYNAIYFKNNTIDVAVDRDDERRLQDGAY